MERVEGEPLTDYCRTHGLSLDDRVRLFASCCDAVDAAHRALVVHRDLKPARMTFEQAAALPQAGQLAVQGLFATGPLRPGMKFLINGAGGGVGTIAIQLAKSQDVEVTGVDRASKLDMMRSHGFLT